VWLCMGVCGVCVVYLWLVGVVVDMCGVWCVCCMCMVY
jgi:hypothetical protein